MFVATRRQVTRQSLVMRCPRELCLMGSTTWTRPSRLALEPRCIGVAPSRPKLRTNFVTRGPNTSLTSCRGFCFPDTATADAPQSLRWRVLDLRTGEAQAADLGYVVGCTVVTREAEEDWRKEKWRQRRARAHLCLAWSYWPLC